MTAERNPGGSANLLMALFGVKLSPRGAPTSGLRRKLLRPKPPPKPKP